MLTFKSGYFLYGFFVIFFLWNRMSHVLVQPKGSSNTNNNNNLFIHLLFINKTNQDMYFAYHPANERMQYSLHAHPATHKHTYSPMSPLQVPETNNKCKRAPNSGDKQQNNMFASYKQRRWTIRRLLKRRRRRLQINLARDGRQSSHRATT